MAKESTARAEFQLPLPVGPERSALVCAPCAGLLPKTCFRRPLRPTRYTVVPVLPLESLEVLDAGLSFVEFVMSLDAFFLWDSSRIVAD